MNANKGRQLPSVRRCWRCAPQSWRWPSHRSPTPQIPRLPDPAVTALTQPTNSIEAGVGYVTQDSFKFGQYNGLFDKGAYGIFNFDVRDDTPYDADSAVRWRIVGTNLGLDTRSAYGGSREAGHVPGQRGLRRAAQQLHRQLPDAIPGQRHRTC